MIENSIFLLTDRGEAANGRRSSAACPCSPFHSLARRLVKCLLRLPSSLREREPVSFCSLTVRHDRIECGLTPRASGSSGAASRSLKLDPRIIERLCARSILDQTPRGAARRLCAPSAARPPPRRPRCRPPPYCVSPGVLLLPFS